MKKIINNLFTYEHPKVPDDCKYLISPSMVSKFYNEPSEWYFTHIKGLEPEFKGNTQTVIGTICHYLFEQNTPKTKVIEKEVINNTLYNFLTLENRTDIDYEEVVNTYPLVATEVMNKYVIPHNNAMLSVNPDSLVVEKPITVKVKTNVYIAGTVDRIEGDCLVDYKIVSSKPNEMLIPLNYKLQLLTYTYALRKLGYYINRIRIVYGVKPTKTISARCFVVTEELTNEHEKLMKDNIDLIYDTIKATEKYPDLAYLFYKDMNIKKDMNKENI